MSDFSNLSKKANKEMLSNSVSQETSIIEKLNANNLPELIGWKEKQEILLKENPYVEIIDNPSYEVAKKSRTNLLKGRTSLESQDKAIASKLTSFRKQVGEKTKELIEITLTAEKKQQDEVTRFENIKEEQRKEKEREEQQRVENIKNKISDIESHCFTVIQQMKFENIEESTKAVNDALKTDFDFQEFDIYFEQATDRAEHALNEKISDLEAKEAQRLKNIELEAENKRIKERQDLQSKRLNELLPFSLFGESVDMTSLCDLSETEYQKVFNSKKAIFDKQESERIESENQRQKETKERQDKIDAEATEAESKRLELIDKTVQVRIKRLSDIGVVQNGNGFFVNIHNDFGCNLESLKNEDIIEFENTISSAIESIKIGEQQRKEAKEQKELEEKQAKEAEANLVKENKARVKRLASDKKFLEGELSKYFSIAPLEFLTENQETKDFILYASQKIETLKNELLEELKNL